MSSTGDFEKIRRRAEEQGFRYEEKTNGHIQFFAPDGKTIVTCSINNWDQSFHSKQNFLSDLKRAGYVHEEEGNGILRDALTNALTAPVERKKPTTELVLEFLQRRADRNIHSSDIRMYVRSKRPDLHETSVYSALKFLKDKGKVLAFSGSYYRHRPESEIAPVSVPLLATVREAPTPPPLPRRRCRRSAQLPATHRSTRTSG